MRGCCHKRALSHESTGGSWRCQKAAPPYVSAGLRHHSPLAILGEPVPTTYVVDSMMVIVTKRRTSKPCTRIQGTVVTLGGEGCFIVTGGASPPVLMEVSVRVGTPVCVRGQGKAWGSSQASAVFPCPRPLFVEGAFLLDNTSPAPSISGISSCNRCQLGHCQLTALCEGRPSIIAHVGW